MQDSHACKRHGVSGSPHAQPYDRAMYYVWDMHAAASSGAKMLNRTTGMYGGVTGHKTHPYAHKSVV